MKKIFALGLIAASAATFLASCSSTSTTSDTASGVTSSITENLSSKPSNGGCPKGKKLVKKAFEYPGRDWMEGTKGWTTTCE